MSFDGLKARLEAFDHETLEALTQLHRRIDYLSAKLHDFWAQHCALARRVTQVEGLPEDTDRVAPPVLDLNSLD